MSRHPPSWYDPLLYYPLTLVYVCINRILGYEVAEMPFDDIVPRPVEQRPIVLLQKARQAQVKTVDTPRTAKLDRNVLSFIGCGASDDDSESDDGGDRKASFSLKRTVLARPQMQGEKSQAKSVEPQQMQKQPTAEPSVPQQPQTNPSQVPVEPVVKPPEDASKVEKEPKRRKRSAEEEEKLLARMERFRNALRASMKDDKDKAEDGNSTTQNDSWMNHTLVFKKVTAAEDDMVREDGEYVTYDPLKHKHSEQKSHDDLEEKDEPRSVERCSRSRSRSRSHHSHHSHHHHHHSHRSGSHSRH